MEFKHFLHQHNLSSTEVKHFLHQHNLSLTEVDKEDGSLCCYECLDVIYGPAFILNAFHDGVEVVMHKSCAKLPPQIQIDAFHPHLLSVSVLDLIVCDGCAKLWAGIFHYRCTDCTFNLDLRCALVILNDYELPNLEALHQGRRIKTTTHHFSHRHQLTRSKFSLSTTEIAKKFFE
ncbi:hypothetical protein PTKIN_Ptkin01aG0355300 [Pterospermum kingtungense]